ncbi:conjugal transfer protein TrbI [Sphaerospermopsis aphanizomenoides BCCUSP55]|uniref:conjugal transfer protein TrbI n=1 Tax=Sphaerospermopsis aphanizomenoides TaxID=459663 RepID=UPI00190805B0|nr:conjugal transfer protein TrbI [Sphaerospermopsis aphanizomenoides]MBK1990586.1 conjugal transfer protein TrbI [Sphaerospermopsis aphanizomenoides BCCUSP55]
MSSLMGWQSSTAALMAMAITTSAVTPLFTFAPAQAQFNLNQSRTVTIPANVTLPVTYEKEKVIVTPGERLPLTLRIANDVIDSNRNVLIPARTEVVGELEPVNLNSGYYNQNKKGVRFVARELVFPSGKRQQINANSRTISETERISQGTDTGQILTDAAIGAGAASVISLLTGNKKIEVLEPVAGAAAGALASVLLRKKQADVYVLRPEDDLDITLGSNLVLSRN